MKKIRITYVVTNLKNTGPINQTYNLIKNLDMNIFEPSVITLWPEGTNSIMDKYQRLGIKILKGNLNKKSTLICGNRYVTRCLTKIKPDIVQGVGMPPYRMCLNYKASLPYVVLRNYCYEDYPSQYGNVLGKIMAMMDMSLIRKQVKKHYPISTCSKSLSKIYKEKEHLELPYIQNGVDISRFNLKAEEKSVELRKRLSLPLDKIVFVYSGRLIDRKNQVELISAFKKAKVVEKAILIILGNGPKKELLEAQLKGVSNIFMLGNVQNIEEYLMASDVYVSSSKSEGLPNGVLEAMATGLPIILSNIPQHIEVMDGFDKCGYSYQLGNENELADCIKCILNDDIKTLGHNAFCIVHNNFSDAIMSKNYSQYYIRMLKENH